MPILYEDHSPRGISNIQKKTGIGFGESICGANRRSSSRTGSSNISKSNLLHQTSTTTSSTTSLVEGQIQLIIVDMRVTGAPAPLCSRMHSAKTRRAPSLVILADWHLNFRAPGVSGSALNNETYTSNNTRGICRLEFQSGLNDSVKKA